MTNQHIAFQGEFQLLGWAESHTRGRTVTFQVDEECADHPFKAFTVRAGRRSGQRFACVLVQIGDDEQPVRQPQEPPRPAPPAEPQPEAERPKGGDLARLAGMLCNDVRFRQWLLSEIPAGTVDEAAGEIRLLCSIDSRAELDHNARAADIFHEHIRKPWLRHIGEAA